MKLTLLGIIALAILTRFIPHMPNAAPITAIAIFAGAYLPKKYALALPLAVRFISDLIIGFFSWPLMVAVYAAHLLGVGFGLWIKKSSEAKNRWLKIAASSVTAAVLFFLITNFALLYANYPHNLSGILLSYANGLPFLRGTFLGDIGYSVVLFGAYELAQAAAKFRGKQISESAPQL